MKGNKKATEEVWLQNNSMTAIKTHPELNRLALKHQIDASYLLWAVLRDCVVSESLSSHFSRNEAYEIAKSYGLTYSRRNFNRILIQGNHIFWACGATKIYMRSFAKVYRLLADEQAISVPQSMFVTISVLKSSLARRAEFYWSWFMERGEQTIARDTIQQLFGLSHDQQRAYEAHLGSRLLVKSNYCHIDADLYKDQLKNIPTYAYSFIQERYGDDTIQTINVIAYQLPNTYIARDENSGESPVSFAPKRALYVSRTLYRLACACGYNERCYYSFYDQWEKSMNPNAYIRTFYQGKKRIHRIGQFI